MKINSAKSILKSLFVLLFFVFSFFPTHRSQAALWPAIDPIIKTALEKIQKQIDGMLLGAAKQASIKAIQQQMNSLIAGGSGSGGAMFVTDWKAYLVTQPQSQANLFINDYISQSLKGRGSLSSYVPAGFEGVGSNSSYLSQLEQGAKAITSNNPAQSQVTFTGDPSTMFAGPDPFKQLNLYLSGVNNPWAFNIDVQIKYQDELEKQKLIAQTKVIAGQGFPGKESNGMTIAPGSVIKDQLSKVQGMGLDMIANAQNLPEIITSAVSMTINQTIQQGIGNVQAQVNREIANAKAKAAAQMTQTIGTQGPGALYNH